MLVYDYIKQAELYLLDTIRENINGMQISAQDAARIAADFLQLLPVYSAGDLCLKLQQLSSLHSSCRLLYLRYAEPYETVSSRKKESVLQDLLIRNKIDKAYYLLKGGVL